MNRFAVVALCAAISGCAANSSTPTHRWAADVPTDRVTYHNDHARCQAQAGLAGERELQANSSAFASYKQCMNDQGYVLTAATD